MTPTQTIPTVSQTDNSHAVEFYSSVDDHVYIASRFAGSVSTTSTGFYAYYAFLFLNGIGFPAFLLAIGQLAAGLVVFLVNAVLVIILIPRANPEGYRKFYEELYQNEEKDLIKVTLNDDGIRYECAMSTTFWLWKAVRLIEETDESIYFFFETNGIGVRKNGFAYPLQATDFTEYARRQLAAEQSGQMPK